MNGIVVIDKPSGPTSFDVVQRVRRILKAKKAGHTGTLDPLATGVLPVCVGEATKVAGLLTLDDKSYDAVIKLGTATDTQDAQGTVVAEAKVPALDASTVESALAKFRGAYEQVPPMYSAVKQDGKRLYELARAGEEVEREPRAVVVHELTARELKPDELTISVRCSKGFFVRVLAHDLAQALGTVGHVKALRRTAVGHLGLDRAVTLEQLESLAVGGEAASRLVSMSDALGTLPAFTVTAADEPRVGHGVPLPVPEGVCGRVRVLAPGGRLLALAEVGPDSRLKYLRVMA